MEIENMYLFGVHKYAFRCGTFSAIMGVKMCTPPNSTPRLCYQLMFPDSYVDYVPVSEVEAGHYTVYTETDMNAILKSQK
jgi:hypothetical protein